MAVIFEEAHLAVVGDVAEDEVAPGVAIGGAFGPAEAGGDPFDAAGALAALEGLVERFDVRGRVAGAGERAERQARAGGDGHRVAGLPG